jgi:K+-transporting ATPase ATPase A chain
MNERDWLQLGLYFAALMALAVPLGTFMERALRGEAPGLRWLKGFERLLYRYAGCDAGQEMTWKSYAGALLLFNAIGIVVVLVLQLAQAALPLNPAAIGNVSWPVALNTAVSFVTNTNWQAYSGEATLSYLTQMLGLTVQNFVSAATGLAVLAALARGLARRTTQTIGNFWTDLTRGTLYVLLPLSLLLALMLAGEGVVQSLSPYAKAVGVEGGEFAVPLGPAASQVAIKQLGTNGGGFFGVNSAHPFENPTPLSNFLQMLAILLLPVAQVFMFGRMVNDRRQGRAILGAMGLLLAAGLGFALWAEFQANPALGNQPFLEGKETRHGILNSVLWGVATTAASNGSVNAMHDSFSPLGGLVTVGNMLLGEVVFGGVGAGLYGMLMFVLLTVFLAGLMVGRTPEYLGKKIEQREILLASLAVLAPCAVVLVCGALGVATETGRASLNNAGPHGLTEILYAFASMANNNGSAFAGLNAATPFYALLGSVAMLIGRFAVIVPALAIAGGLAAKKVSPPSAGTFPTHGPLFVLLLVGVVVIVGGLTFLPALTLGPIVEHLLMQQGRLF